MKNRVATLAAQMVERTPWSARDALVGLLAPRKMLMSLCRLRDQGVRPTIPRGWFFDSVGMGLRPAKLHEKLPLRGLTRLPWISGAFCRKFAGSPVCPRFPGPAPRIGFSPLSIRVKESRDNPGQSRDGQSRDSIRNSRIPAGFAGITDTVPGFDPGFDRVSMARSKDPRRAAPRYRPAQIARVS